MLVFDKRYNLIVSKYIAPLADYGVPYQKLRQNALKTVLTEKVQTIDVLGDTSVVFHFTKSAGGGRALRSYRAGLAGPEPVL